MPKMDDGELEEFVKFCIEKFNGSKPSDKIFNIDIVNQMKLLKVVEIFVRPFSKDQKYLRKNYLDDNIETINVI